MPIKKNNLAPDVKSRLRQAVLGEIDRKHPAPPSSPTKAIPKASQLSAKSNANHPQLKTLKKINFEPLAISSMPSKTTLKMKKSEIVETNSAIKPKQVAQPTKKIAKTAKAKAVKVKTATKIKVKEPIVSNKPTVSPVSARTVVAKKPTAPSPFINKRPSLYKSGTLDWQKPVKEDSLESIFSTPPRASFKDVGVKPSKPVKERRSAGGGKIILKLIAVIIGVLLLVVLFDIFGIYRLGFRDVVSTHVAKVLQLPVGQVNGKFLSLSEYMTELGSLSAAIIQNREGLIDYSNNSDIKNKIFYRLAANYLMEDKLGSYKVYVTQNDVASQIDLLIQQTGGRAQAETIVKATYGLDLDSFSSQILRPMVVREALQKAIISDQSLDINLAVKSKAEEVLKLALATSSDFATLAKQYTEDESGINTGGDLGWVVKGQLDPRWDDLIFNEATSSVVPQIVVSNYGYHIIKIEQRLKDKDTGAESVKLRHILIKVDVDKYIKSLLDNAKLVKYIQ